MRPPTIRDPLQGARVPVTRWPGNHMGTRLVMIAKAIPAYMMKNAME